MMTTDGHRLSQRTKRLLRWLGFTVGSLAWSSTAMALDVPVMPVGYGYQEDGCPTSACEPSFVGGCCDNSCLDLWSNYCSERRSRFVRSPRRGGDCGPTCGNLHSFAPACPTCSVQPSPVMNAAPHVIPTPVQDVPLPQPAALPSAPPQPAPVQPQPNAAPAPPSPSAKATSRHALPIVITPTTPPAPATPITSTVPAADVGQVPPDPDDVTIPEADSLIPKNTVPDNTTTLPSSQPVPSFEFEPTESQVPPAPAAPSLDESSSHKKSGAGRVAKQTPAANPRGTRMAPPEPETAAVRFASTPGNSGTTRLLRQLKRQSIR